ncbi:hypothetical protein Dimus_029369 [Dionaea muscipula]
MCASSSDEISCSLFNCFLYSSPYRDEVPGEIEAEIVEAVGAEKVLRKFFAYHHPGPIYLPKGQNWEIMAPWTRAQVMVPMRFIVGDWDLTPGVKDYIHNSGMKIDVPFLPGSGDTGRTDIASPCEIGCGVVNCLASLS